MKPSSEIEKSQELTVKAECAQCGGIRNASIIANYLEKNSDDDFDLCVDWFLLRCCGCEHVFVLTISTHYDKDANGEITSAFRWPFKYWPALSARKEPDWLFDINSDRGDAKRLVDTLAELYGALNNELHMLAAIGIRTTFDIAAELLNMDSSQPFKAKLEALEKAGHIGGADRSRLETLVDAGSASAHRGWRPDKKDLGTMMDVLEHFIYRSFVAPKRWDSTMDEMKSKIPQRKTKSK